MRAFGIWEMVRKRDREIHTQEENEIERDRDGDGDGDGEIERQRKYTLRTSTLPVSAQMWRQVRPCESVAFATDPFEMQSSTRSTPACFALQASMSIKFCLQNLPFFCSACSAPFFMVFPHVSLTLLDARTNVVRMITRSMDQGLHRRTNERTAAKTFRSFGSRNFVSPAKRDTNSGIMRDIRFRDIRAA
jgi:hypothetical protein